MRLFKTFTVIVATVMMGAFAQAQQKIATLDVERALKDYYKHQQVETQLNKELETIKADAKIREENLKKMAEEHNALVKEMEATADEAAKKDLAQQIMVKRQTIDTLNKQRQATLQTALKGLQEKMQTQIAALIKVVDQTAANVAKTKKADIVLDSSALTPRGNHSVVFTTPALDITDSVLKELNKDAPKGYVPNSKKPKTEAADNKRSL